MKRFDVAQEMYLSLTPIYSSYEIAEKVQVSQMTIQRWAKDNQWSDEKARLFEENVVKCCKNETTFITTQKELTYRATIELLERLKQGDITLKTENLISIMKHGLDVMRPKTMAQLTSITNNLHKHEKVVIQIIKPHDGKEDKIQSNPKAIQSTREARG